jgi:hypothetical protein
VSTYDKRFDEAELDVDRGSPWMFKEEGAPNPLTIEVEEWVEITTTYGAADLMIGRDRDRKRWSVLVGEKATILRKKLIDGIVEEFDEKQNAFVQTAVLGKVEPGEVVSIKFKGTREGTQGPYNNFEISRKPALPADEQDAAAEVGDQPATQGEDGIPFDDGVPE